jgi:hypothetical protein
LFYIIVRTLPRRCLVLSHMVLRPIQIESNVPRPSKEAVSDTGSLHCRHARMGD